MTFSQADGLRSERTIYTVRNSTVSSERQSVENNVLKIAGRASSTMVKHQGNADLCLDYLVARERDAGYRAIAIGNDFAIKYVGPFNRKYRNQLYSYGHANGLHRNPWHDSPTGLLQAARVDP